MQADQVQQLRPAGHVRSGRAHQRHAPILQDGLGEARLTPARFTAPLDAAGLCRFISLLRRLA